MTEQFENPEEQKVEDEIVSMESPEKRIENVAEKAAKKAGETVKKYDKDTPIFSK
jgi:hypothetical protein